MRFDGSGKFLGEEGNGIEDLFLSALLYEH